MSAPAEALALLAETLASEATLLSPEVIPQPVSRTRSTGRTREEPSTGRTREEPVFGLLVAAGPRAGDAPGEYALLVETIREGYLLHYGTPRVLACADPDLALLAGDYLYARGLERLASLGDLEAVRELADLISLSAQLATRPSSGDADALWLAAAVAIGCGPSPEHEAAKSAVRLNGPGVAALLWEGAASAARPAGVSNALYRAAEAVGFRAHPAPEHAGKEPDPG